MMYIDNHSLMVAKFESVMAKLAVLGQNPRDLVDCSEVIPQPPAFNGPATFPAGFGLSDIEQGVREIVYPIYS